MTPDKRFLLVCLIGGAMAAAAPVYAQNSPQMPRLVPIDGSQIFHNHCAACHGNDGRGSGPATASLKHKVPDLTSIARKNGGTFPRHRVKTYIAGTEDIPSAHGSREMPIWGPIFHDFEWDQDLGEVRLQNITDYLESLQQK
jgi:mono/diheme cytochrome c family protein